MQELATNKSVLTPKKNIPTEDQVDSAMDWHFEYVLRIERCVSSESGAECLPDDLL